MFGFSDILKKGRRRHDVKTRGGNFGRCEECDARTRLYPFDDEKKEIWLLCEDCLKIFVNEVDK